jgi:hypothetical protein
MRSHKLAMVAALLVAATSAQAQVTVYSESFNSAGLPSGWTGTTGPTGSNSYGVTSSSLGSNAGFVSGTATLTSPTFTLSGDGYISFFAQFSTIDYMPFNDVASLEQWNGSSWTTVFFASVSQTGNTNGNSTTMPWNFVYNNATAGTYQLKLSVDNALDDAANSTLKIDNINAVVTPEPGSIALMATGLVGVIGFGMRRRKQKA